MLKFLKIFFINIIILFFFIIIYELFFGGWFNAKNFGNLFLPLNKYEIISNLPYKADQPIIYSTDEFGFRSNFKKLDTIEILVVGGSTTEQKLIDDEKIWTKVLEKNTKKNVLNAGIGGQTSFGHVEMFSIRFNRLPNLKPNLIIYYLGINDAFFLLSKAQDTKNKKTPTNGRIFNSINRDKLLHDNKLKNIAQYIKNNSAAVQLYKFIKGNYISFKYKFNYMNKKTTKFETSSNNEIKINFNSINSNILKQYQYLYNKNLRILQNMATKNDAYPIFITQKISKNHWLNDYLKYINNLTLKYCINNNLYCIDMSQENNLKDDFFYDGVHLNPKGSEILGDYISQKIMNYKF